MYFRQFFNEESNVDSSNLHYPGCDIRYRFVDKKQVSKPEASRIVEVIKMLCVRMGKPELTNVEVTEIAITKWDARNCHFNLRGKDCYANLNVGNESLFVSRN